MRQPSKPLLTMKTPSVVTLVIVLSGLLSGCGTVSNGVDDSLNNQVAAKQREMQKISRVGSTEPADSQRTTYPGGTTAAEWKSLSSTGQK